MQFLAMFTMLIDHIGVVFFPENAYLRIIGRIAFPLYAYALVQGYHYTRSRPKYAWRLFVLAILSQLPFMWAFSETSLNVIATLLLCLLVLMLIDWLNPNNRRRYLAYVVAIPAFVLMEWVPMDYGGYALLLVLIYRYSSPRWMLIWHTALNVFFAVYQLWIIQLFSVISTWAVVQYPKVKEWFGGISIPRWLWRSFYPAHLLLLAVLSSWLNAHVQ
ncbi:TraX family protein [Paenibacillus senegalensis]|uniref:TraX family protein n=1 Tax=Paenibacillus senegalensis TaxID=1465766 RepID=UPI000288D21D|nr:TraX family protein [Paenibacillus senegalensis]